MSTFKSKAYADILFAISEADNPKLVCPNKSGYFNKCIWYHFVKIFGNSIFANVLELDISGGN